MRKNMRAGILSLLALIVSFLCLPSSIGSVLSNSATGPIYSSGTIMYQTSKLVFQTSFEDVTHTAGAHSIGLNDVNGTHISNQWYIGTTPAAAADLWIEGIDKTLLPTGYTPHSGTSCLGLSVNPSGSAGYWRSQLNVYAGNLIGGAGKEYHFKGWYFLPPNWSINSSDAAVVAGNYYSIANPFSDIATNDPLIEIELHLGRTGNSWDGTYDVVVTWRGNPWGWAYDWSLNPTYGSVANGSNFPWMNLRGRWFPIEWYVKLDSSTNPDAPNNDGVIKVWLDGVLLVNRSGVPIVVRTAPYIVIGKIYQGGMDMNAKQLFVDDIEMWV